MYSIHAICFFSETDFCLPYSSVVRLAPFLKSLVVCCP